MIKHMIISELTTSFNHHLNNRQHPVVVLEDKTDGTIGPICCSSQQTNILINLSHCFMIGGSCYLELTNINTRLMKYLYIL